MGGVKCGSNCLPISNMTFLSKCTMKTLEITAYNVELMKTPHTLGCVKLYLVYLIKD